MRKTKSYHYYAWIFLGHNAEEYPERHRRCRLLTARMNTTIMHVTQRAMIVVKEKRMPYEEGGGRGGDSVF